jgi:hypothetical protein
MTRKPPIPHQTYLDVRFSAEQILCYMIYVSDSANLFAFLLSPAASDSGKL